MPRPAKPFFRRQTKSWYCSIAGKQISLGKDKKLAVQKFHELMTNICVLFIANDAYMRDYKVLVPNDCCAAVDLKNYKLALNLMENVLKADFVRHHRSI